jgi:hypothetical protein
MKIEIDPLESHGNPEFSAMGVRPRRPLANFEVKQSLRKTN